MIKNNTTKTYLIEMTDNEKAKAEAAGFVVVEANLVDGNITAKPKKERNSVFAFGVGLTKTVYSKVADAGASVKDKTVNVVHTFGDTIHEVVERGK